MIATLLAGLPGGRRMFALFAIAAVFLLMADIVWGEGCAKITP